MKIEKQYPHYENGFFYNNKDDVIKSSSLNMISLYLKNTFSFYTLKSFFIFNKFYKFEEIDLSNYFYNDFPVIVPIGHATILIIYKGISFITDPLFYSSSFFLKRYISPTPSEKSFPPIDFVLLSHDHQDHCDNKSLNFLFNKNNNLKCMVPLKMSSIIEKTSIKNINEYNWWDTYEEIYKNIKIKITCLPANHWSQHTFLTGRNKTLWCSWMIEIDEYKIYFAGDSAHDKHFYNIGNEFKDIDCAILPIAPYEPIEIQKNSHMSINEVILAFKELNARILIPIHWGVFRLGLEKLEDPIFKLKEFLKKENKIEYLRGSNIGEPVILKK